MKLLSVILFFLVASALAVPTQIPKDGPPRVFEDHWMEMPVDHFNLFDNETWQMRYFLNDEFFVENGPIFLEVGAETTLDGKNLECGQLYKLAKQHQGLLVQNEHRYYGKSLPFSTNFTTETFLFLEIQQTLEDLALFIEKIKTSDPKYKHSKVVLHGCSYSGLLATWMRLKFPHFVDMAYASSAPLGVGLEYPDYAEIINDIYDNVPVKCIDSIKEGFNATTQLMKTHDGRVTVREALEDWKCANTTKMNSYEILHKMVKILDVRSKDDEAVCDQMEEDGSADAFHKLINMVILKSENSEVCQGSTNKDDVTNVETEAYRNHLAWTYQTCTEQGSFQTLKRDKSHHPFQLDITLQESVNECSKVFDGLITEHVLKTGVERVYRRFGGKKPVVTKVLLVQGTQDPWKQLQEYHVQVPILLAEGSHCAEVFENDDDTEELVQVRNKARDQISQWLEETA